MRRYTAYGWVSGEWLETNLAWSLVDEREFVAPGIALIPADRPLCFAVLLERTYRVTQIYEFLFPNDGEAASAQATLADKIAVAEGTMRVAPGFRYGQAYLVVNLPDEADLVETLSPFIQGHWQIPGMRWEVELDKEATDEEVELTAQDIAEEEAYYAYWRYRVDGAEDIPEGEPIPPRGEEG